MTIYHTRIAVDGYTIPGETLYSAQNINLPNIPWEDGTFIDMSIFPDYLNEPPFQEAIERPKKRTRSETRPISPEKKIITSILASWPSEPSDEHLDACVNACGFQHLFWQHFKYVSPIEPKDSQKFGSLKAGLMGEEGKKKWRDIFSMFISEIGRTGKPEAKQAYQDAKARREELRKIREGGLKMRRKAIYIGIERSEEPIARKKHIVETRELLELGLKTEVFHNRDGGNYVLLDDKVHRICAPDRKLGIFIVFWEKDGPHDTSYSEEKMIGAVVYNPHKFTDKLSIDKDVAQIEQDQGFKIFSARSWVDRTAVVTGGAMVKSVGPHATNTKLWDGIYLKDDTIIDEDTRLLTPDINAFIQARYFSLLSGAIPEYAKQVLNIAQSNLMNRLGVPSMSHFHAFNYSASSHLDNDDSPSIGWVARRPQDMHRNTGNFFWSEYRLVLELQEGMYWWWSAANNEHGTTMNHQAILAGRAKPTWAEIKAAKNEGQWTAVTVLPKSVNKAAKIVNRS